VANTDIIVTEGIESSQSRGAIRRHVWAPN
jgi:hypothetical protein